MKRMLTVGTGIVLCLACGLAIWLLAGKNSNTPEIMPEPVSETVYAQEAGSAAVPAQEVQALAASENTAVPGPVAETAPAPKPLAVPPAIPEKTGVGANRAVLDALKTELAREQEKYFEILHQDFKANIKKANTALASLIREAFTSFPDFAQARAALADVVDWRELPSDYIDDNFGDDLMMQEQDNPIIYYREYIDGREDTADFMVMQHVWQESWDRQRDEWRPEEEREYMYYSGWGGPYFLIKNADSLSAVTYGGYEFKSNEGWGGGSGPADLLCVDIIPENDSILALPIVEGPVGSGNFIYCSISYCDIRKNKFQYWSENVIESIGNMKGWAYDGNSRQLTLTPRPDPDHPEVTPQDTIIDINAFIERNLPKTIPE